jgi:hypothetical protein
VYDDLALYIGVWCFQQEKTIHAKYMQRDFNYEEYDNFQVALSPFSDRRNGYLFVINPNGARADLFKIYLQDWKASSGMRWKASPE